MSPVFWNEGDDSPGRAFEESPSDEPSAADRELIVLFAIGIVVVLAAGALLGVLS